MSNNTRLVLTPLRIIRSTALFLKAKANRVLEVIDSAPQNLYVANEVAATESHFLANEMKTDGKGWICLSPYGQFRNNSNGHEITQEITKTDAQEMVSEFNSMANIGTKILGLPWYIGHPDHPGFQDRYTDTKSYGRIKGLEAREDGLWANVKWNDAGKSLIDQEAFHGHSVNWRMKRVGPNWRPVSLKSVGFTNEPNIPVAPILTANEKTNMNFIDWVKSLLGLDATSDEANVKSKMETMANDARAYADAKPKIACNETLTTEVANHKATITTLTAERDTARTEMANAKTKADADLLAANSAKATAETNFANERAARAKDLLDIAVTTGKITGADRKAYETEFANATMFDATLKKLNAANAKVLHTTSFAQTLAARGNEGRPLADQVQDCVNERMISTKCSYDEAWKWVQKEKAGLFANMKQPEDLSPKKGQV